MSSSKVLTWRWQTANTIIGVSKRCCTVCTRLLSYLGDELGTPYFVLGSHPVISASSLPSSISDHVMDRMIAHFGSQLKDAILRLETRLEAARLKAQSTPSPADNSNNPTQPRRDAWRQRSNSTESHPMSVASNEECGAGTTFLDNIYTKLDTQRALRNPAMGSLYSKMKDLLNLS
jgi:hypothetical protein